MDELSDRDLAMLDFERSWWMHPGPKDVAVRDRFDMSPTRYYQRLSLVIERPEALAHDPLLVKRLRRLRGRRRQQAAAARLGI